MITLTSYEKDVLMRMAELELHIGINFLTEATYTKHGFVLRKNAHAIDRFERVFAQFFENCLDNINLIAIDVVEHAYSKYGFPPKKTPHPNPDNRSGMIDTGETLRGLYETFFNKKGHSWTNESSTTTPEGLTVDYTAEASAARDSYVSDVHVVQNTDEETYDGYMDIRGHGYFEFKGYPFDSRPMLQPTIYNEVLLSAEDWIKDSWGDATKGIAPAKVPLSRLPATSEIGKAKLEELKEREKARKKELQSLGKKFSTIWLNEAGEEVDGDYKGKKWRYSEGAQKRAASRAFREKQMIIDINYENSDDFHDRVVMGQPTKKERERKETQEAKRKVKSLDRKQQILRNKIIENRGNLNQFIRSGKLKIENEAQLIEEQRIERAKERVKFHDTVEAIARKHGGGKTPLSYKAAKRLYHKFMGYNVWNFINKTPEQKLPTKAKPTVSLRRERINQRNRVARRQKEMENKRKNKSLGEFFNDDE